MDWTQEQYNRIASLLPKQCRNIGTLTFFRVLQYIAENGCKWRKLPEHFEKLVTAFPSFEAANQEGKHPDALYGLPQREACLKESEEERV